MLVPWSNKILIYILYYYIILYTICTHTRTFEHTPHVPPTVAIY